MDDEGNTHGHMLSYVDDFLIASTPEIISALQAKIASIWKISLQNTISQDSPGTLRYLSIHVTIDASGKTSLSQAG